MEENINKTEVISERKLKWYKFKANCREKINAAVDWCKENKEILILAVYEYYDPHTGAHWQLKRRLNNSERAELMRRQRDGEYTEDILYDMNVLK